MKFKALLAAILLPSIMSFFYIHRWLGNWSIIIWIILLLAAVYIIGKFELSSPYRTAFFTGFLWGIIAGVLQFIFSEPLLQNNPQLAYDLYEAGYKDFDYVFLVRGPMFGAIFGVVMTIGVFFFKRLAESTKRQSL